MMNRMKLLYVVSLLFVLQNICAQTDLWKNQYETICKSIRVPLFGKSKYVITDFGATQQASAAENQKAINKAIAKCSLDGGGTVVIPKGTWRTGAIRLMSCVNLFTEEGALLLFSDDTSLYPLVRTRWEGIELMNYSPFIYADSCHDVAITGNGVFDGQADKNHWWPMCGAAKHGWTEQTSESQRDSRNDLLRMNDQNVPIEQRIFGQGKGLRPQFVNFYRCRRVLIEGVAFLNSPFWSIHPLLCTDVTVKKVRIDNSGPNGDGCNPESCNRVLIENCYFNTGDDCIAIKSGRNADGRRAAIPSENIVIRKCQMKNGHGGVVIGSEISGGVRNVFVEDCTMDSPNLERVIRIKTNTCRGGVTDGIYVRNIEVGQCKEAILKINLVYEPQEPSQRGFYPMVKNVWLDNVNSKSSRYGAFIDALPDSLCVSNVRTTNCRWDGITSQKTLLRGKYERVDIE